MNEGTFNNSREKLDIKVEVATKKDWEAYREIDILAASGSDAGMLAITPQQAIEQKEKSEQGWKKDLSSDTMFVVLSWNGSVAVGMGIASRRGDDVWYLRADYVKENFRNQGIAKMMLAERLNEIQKRGGKKVTSDILVNNNASLRVYEFFGFKKANTISVRVGRKRMSAYKMELLLGEQRKIDMPFPS